MKFIYDESFKALFKCALLSLKEKHEFYHISQFNPEWDTYKFVKYIKLDLSKIDSHELEKVKKIVNLAKYHFSENRFNILLGCLLEFIEGGFSLSINGFYTKLAVNMQREVLIELEKSKLLQYEKKDNAIFLNANFKNNIEKLVCRNLSYLHYGSYVFVRKNNKTYVSMNGLIREVPFYVDSPDLIEFQKQKTIPNFSRSSIVG